MPMSDFEYKGDRDSDDDDYSESIDYNRLSQEEKDEIDEEKASFEKGKYKLYKQIPSHRMMKNGKSMKYIKKVVIYSTRSTPGSRIRDPVFGTFSSDKVGSKSEYHYFKVRMPDIPTEDRTPITLYYDSPEGYEKHQHIRISQSIKNAWHDRRAEYTGYDMQRFDTPGSIEIK